MARRFVALGLALAVGMSAMAGVPTQDCVVSLMTTCTRLAANNYPEDTVNWFYPSRHAQAVYFTHMLFPLAGEGAEPVVSATPTAAPEGWHPPLALATVEPAVTATPHGVRPDFQPYVQAIWVAPDERRIADFGLTLPARASKEFVRLGGRYYIPHSFGMAIGTRDVRPAAGQRELPDQKGLYHIDLYIQGKLAGVTFFSVLEGKVAQTPVATPASPKTDAARQAAQAAAAQSAVSALQGGGGMGTSNILMNLLNQAASATPVVTPTPGFGRKAPMPTPHPTVAIEVAPIQPLSFPQPAPAAPGQSGME